MTKRQITATAPDGTQVTVNVGPKREVVAIRITGGFPTDVDDNGQWIVSVHKSLDAAITGPNQTPMWNNRARWAVAIDANDQASGAWLPASK